MGRPLSVLTFPVTSETFPQLVYTLRVKSPLFIGGDKAPMPSRQFKTTYELIVWLNSLGILVGSYFFFFWFQSNLLFLWEVKPQYSMSKTLGEKRESVGQTLICQGQIPSSVGLWCCLLMIFIWSLFNKCFCYFVDPVFGFIKRDKCFLKTQYYVILYFFFSWGWQISLLSCPQWLWLKSISFPRTSKMAPHHLGEALSFSAGPS